MKFTKKASLNLSINAIVILILAITMLGLGLAFMRNIFGTAIWRLDEKNSVRSRYMNWHEHALSDENFNQFNQTNANEEYKEFFMSTFYKRSSSESLEEWRDRVSSTLDEDIKRFGEMSVETANRRVAITQESIQEDYERRKARSDLLKQRKAERERLESGSIETYVNNLVEKTDPESVIQSMVGINGITQEKADHIKRLYQQAAASRDRPAAVSRDEPPAASRSPPPSSKAQPRGSGSLTLNPVNKPVYTPTDSPKTQERTGSSPQISIVKRTDPRVSELTAAKQQSQSDPLHDQLIADLDEVLEDYYLTFKPTVKLGEKIPSLRNYRDFSFYATTSVDARRESTKMFEELFIGERSNVILVKGHRAPTTHWGSRFVHALNEDWGNQHWVSVCVWPGAYNQDQNYSVDRRSADKATIGTAYVGLDFPVSTTGYDKAMKALKHNLLLMNEFFFRRTFSCGRDESFNVFSTYCEPNGLEQEHIRNHREYGENLVDTDFPVFFVRLNDLVNDGPDAIYEWPGQ